MRFWTLVCEALKLVGLAIAATAFGLMLWEAARSIER